MSETLSAKFETLLAEAQSQGANDLHLIPGEPPTVRVDGILKRGEGEPLTPKEVMEMASTVIAKEDLDRIGREVGELHRSIVVGDMAARICVSRASGEITIAAGLLPTSVPDVEKLKVPQALIDATSSASGLIVLTGLAGSGKSTTAYSLLDHINIHHQANIATVEDPVTYRLTPKRSIVQQREVGVDVPSMLAGIKAPILTDPDVIFVNNLAGLEVLQACFYAAEMGHLVMALMSAVSPEAAIQRMIEVFPGDMTDTIRHQLSRVLRCVSCQRLLPHASGKGRVAVYGVLVPDEEMRAAIAEGRDLLARRSPMPDDCLSMPAEIERVAREGVISEETAKAYLARM